ncbi:GNAT family N-acetyltransferase [Flavobacterium sp. MXW15]|uniref:GNAT family N-acetyltransferase n=1 Tax=Xanthomonas chitinilytica TaxID=2989819 RepID=A0ABT3JTV5_9XANT|nr:GNAT family protein [Xanthomonas sp. H13-6]MCW4454688.1 GNAT family N-acetyltransferase [Flavobacterium sp. MXW15]MCW4471927.1 GNAT family N-acetyltransferase [Xanthomonas sp. H13-6]
MPEPSPRIEGDGFALRRWRADDLDTLVLHANDEAVSQGLRDRFPYPYTRADGEAFLSGRILPLDGPTLAIEVEGRACGGIGASAGSGERAHSAELGYWLGRALWGRGIMTRVVAAYVPWALRTLRLYRLQAEVLDSNPASARVLLKNGFVEEGTARRAVFKRGVLHDLRRFALTRAALD